MPPTRKLNGPSNLLATIASPVKARPNRLVRSKSWGVAEHRLWHPNAPVALGSMIDVQQGPAGPLGISAAATRPTRASEGAATPLPEAVSDRKRPRLNSRDECATRKQPSA